MPIDPAGATRSLPDRPNLRHLKAQARDLLDAGAATSVTDAQFQLARQYGFPSWPKLKAHVESVGEMAQLEHAIDHHDLGRVQAMMTHNPALHRAKVIRNRIDLLAAHLDADPSLLRRRFPELDFGTTGGRRLTLRGGTLLHVAAEYCNLEATTLLLDRGADIDARATQGVGGQTPTFHAVTQRGDEGLRVARLLVERGADLSVRARVPGHYERPDEVLHCTPLEYALAFEDEPWPGDKVQTTRFLRSQDAAE
jgi:hypothetical protein